MVTNDLEEESERRSQQTYRNRYDKKMSVTRRYHIGDDSWHAVDFSGRGSAKGGIMQKTKVDKNDVQKAYVPQKVACRKSMCRMSTRRASMRSR